ncbi:MAG TPA: TonB family protein [Rhodocyclaceae bacterium]|nr:TonB family protein [Rhodocyclaceae bacterium]
MAFDSTATENEARRRMVAASAVSAILHLIVLWPRFPDLPEPVAPQQPVLRARLRQPTTDAHPLPAPRPALAVPPAPTLAKVRQRPAAAVTMQAQESSPAPVVSAPSSPLSIAPRAPSAAAVTSSSPAASAASAAPPPAVDAGSFAEGLRVYRIALATQARRFKRYPAAAQAAGWGGTVEVRLDLPAGALTPALSLARSSGHEALDRAALAMVDAGIARVGPSDLLRERGFTLLLPVLFELDE